MDNIIKDIRKWEHREKKVNILIVAAVAWCIVMIILISNTPGNLFLYDLVCTLAWVGLGLYLALVLVKVVIHYVMFAPLIHFKLSEFLEKKEPDPDFDIDKYYDWK